MKIFQVCLILAVFSTEIFAEKFVYWNRDSPMFRLDNMDHIVDVKEYDQVHLVCPESKPSEKYPEQHVIYSVSKEEFDNCRITNPKPRIVAICNSPYHPMYFTITFRSFTPTPGGLEFKPGNDYYFISTSSRSDLHRRVGGGCASHNMKMIFKVHANDRTHRLQKQHQEEHLRKMEEETNDVIFHPHINIPRLNTISDSISSTEKLSDSSSDRYYYQREVFPKMNQPVHFDPDLINDLESKVFSPLPLTDSFANSCNRNTVTQLNLLIVTILSVLYTIYFQSR